MNINKLLAKSTLQNLNDNPPPDFDNFGTLYSYI